MAKDFTADSYRVGSIVRALTETVNGQLVFRDSDVPGGITLRQLSDITGNAAAITEEVYTWLTQISGQIGMEMVADLSGQVIEYTNLVYTFDQRITTISGDLEQMSVHAAFTDVANIFTEPQIIDDALLINHRDISGVGLSLLSVSGDRWVSGGSKTLICDLTGAGFPLWNLNTVNISGGVPEDMVAGTVISAGNLVATVSYVNRANSYVSVYEYIDGWQAISGAPFNFVYANRLATFTTPNGYTFFMDGMGRVGISTEELNVSLPGNGPNIDASSMLTLLGGKTVDTKGKANILIQDIESQIRFALSTKEEAHEGYIRRTDDVNEKELTIGASVGGVYEPDYRRDFAVETTYETSKGQYYWPSYEYMAEARHTLDQRVRGTRVDKVFAKNTQNLNLVIGATDNLDYNNGSATVHIRESDWIDIYGAGLKSVSDDQVTVDSVESYDQARFAWQLRPGDLVQYGTDGEIRTVTDVNGHNEFTVDTPWGISGDGSENWKAKRHLFVIEGTDPEVVHPNNLNDGMDLEPGFFGDVWFSVDALGYARLQNSDTRLGQAKAQLVVANDNADTTSNVTVAFEINGTQHHSLVQLSGCFSILSATGGNNGLHISKSGFVGIGDIGCDTLETDAVSLNVEGSAKISNDLVVEGNAEVDLELLVRGNANVWGDANITGSANILTDINVSGNATIEGNTNISGDTSIAGNTNILLDLTVDGNTYLGSDLLVDGNATIMLDLGVGGNTTISGSENVLVDLTVGGNAVISGNTTVGMDLLVNGDATFLGSMSISGTLGVEYLNVTNDAWIGRNLWADHIFANKSTVIEHELMTITSNIIYLNAGEVGISGVYERYSGIKIDRGPTRDGYGILFDEVDNTFKVGVYSLTGAELIGVGNDTFLSYLQPVATRTTITEGYIPFGNGANQYTETANAYYTGAGSLRWDTSFGRLLIGGSVSATAGAIINGSTVTDSLQVNGLATITGNLTVSGTALFEDSVGISGSATVDGDLSVKGNASVAGHLDLGDGINTKTPVGISGDNILDAVDAVAAKWMVVVESISGGGRYASEVHALNDNGVIDYTVSAVLGSVFNPTVYVELVGNNLVLKLNTGEDYKAKTSRISLLYF